MNNWNDACHWAFGHGYWYADPIDEVKGMSDEQLFWMPTPKSLCALWHVGHIAHRERCHIGHFLQGFDESKLIPFGFNVFAGWNSADEIRENIESPEAVFEWMRDVRRMTHDYISSLTEADFHSVPPRSVQGNSVARVLLQTVGHTGVHIGRIQMLRAMLEEAKERAC